MPCAGAGANPERVKLLLPAHVLLLNAQRKHVSDAGVNQTAPEDEQFVKVLIAQHPHKCWCR